MTSDKHRHTNSSSSSSNKNIILVNIIIVNSDNIIHIVNNSNLNKKEFRKGGFRRIEFQIIQNLQSVLSMVKGKLF